jgi:hypothetical protein
MKENDCKLEENGKIYCSWEMIGMAKGVLTDDLFSMDDKN